MTEGRTERRTEDRLENSQTVVRQDFRHEARLENDKRTNNNNSSHLQY